MDGNPLRNEKSRMFEPSGSPDHPRRLLKRYAMSKHARAMPLEESDGIGSSIGQKSSGAYTNGTNSAGWGHFIQPRSAKSWDRKELDRRIGSSIWGIQTRRTWGDRLGENQKEVWAMIVRLLSPVQFELDEAVKYYDHQLPGLGFRFFQETAAAIKRIRVMPEAWTKVASRHGDVSWKVFPTLSFTYLKKMKSSSPLWHIFTETRNITWTESGKYHSTVVEPVVGGDCPDNP
jgi:hypothetical protein